MDLAPRKPQTPEEIERDVVAFLSTEKWVKRVKKLETGWYAVTTTLIEPNGHNIMTYLYYWPGGKYWSVDDLENFEQEFCSQNPNNRLAAGKGITRACDMYNLEGNVFSIQVDTDKVIAEALRISSAQLTAYGYAYFVMNHG